MNEYFKMMESMLLKVGLQFESEEEKLARFVSGLRREVQDVVELYKYSTLEKILHLALKVESELKKKQEAKRSTPYNDYCSRNWKGEERKDEKPLSKDHPPRTNSSRTSHESANSSQGSRTSSIKCFKCLGYGHIASICPTKRNMIFNPKGEVESEHSSPLSPKSCSSHTSSQSSSEDEIKPNEGGLLVVRRMLSQVPKEFENQRENIFHLRCQINNKTCSLIIDSGSCVNVASTRVVDKLGLKTIPHAKPYKLSWLSGEGEIKVDK